MKHVNKIGRVNKLEKIAIGGLFAGALAAEKLGSREIAKSIIYFDLGYCAIIGWQAGYNKYIKEKVENENSENKY